MRLSKNSYCNVKNRAAGELEDSEAAACQSRAVTEPQREKARLKLDKPPQKDLICQGFRAKRHFERFQNARRISAVKKVSRTFLTSWARLLARPLVPIVILSVRRTGSRCSEPVRMAGSSGSLHFLHGRTCPARQPSLSPFLTFMSGVISTTPPSL